MTAAAIRISLTDMFLLLFIRSSVKPEEPDICQVIITYRQVDTQGRNRSLTSRNHPRVRRYVAVIIPSPAVMWDITGMARP